MQQYEIESRPQDADYYSLIVTGTDGSLNRYRYAPERYKYLEVYQEAVRQAKTGALVALYFPERRGELIEKR